MSARALAIAAHPDDIEFVMSGTLMRLREVGFELHYLNVANGCCGSTEMDAAEAARVRRTESIAAALKLGAVYHESLTDDLAIFYERDLLAQIAAIVREVDPSIVLTHSPTDYMEDHTNTCRLAVTATFARGMPNFPTYPVQPAVNRQVTLYHAQPHGNRDGLRQLVTPELFVDVTDVMERKCELLECHASQKEWLDESQGMDSYLEAMKSLLSEVGKLSGRYEYAEGWRRHSHLGFCDESADPLAKALRRHVTKSDAN
ncbi:MAG: PIG-L family deacetylase [Planctomycetales bacterium]|nr:PIG-L family deacetylase [Planctomycetales bacterium]